MQKYTLSILVENHLGALSRVSGVFSKKGYQINSLSFDETENPKFSRMTIVFNGNIQFLDQIQKQLKKLIDVREIEELRQEQVANIEHQAV